MHRPKLSIVVLSYNRADLLRDCLNSIKRHAPRWIEVLIVDDVSPGGTVRAVAETFDCRCLTLSQRGGFCVAANAGVRAAEADIVQVLNDDTEVTAGWAESALQRFEDASVVAVTPLVLKGRPGEGPIVDSTGDGYWPVGVAYKRGHGQALQAHHLVAGPVFGASGSASFFRRSAFLEAGGFAEELIAYFDDIDLSFRLNRLGRVWYEPNCVVHHRVSSSYGKPADELLELQSRNEELVWWRNLSTLARWLWLPAHVGVLLAKALRRVGEGQLGPFLRGRWRALTEVVPGPAFSTKTDGTAFFRQIPYSPTPSAAEERVR